MERSFSNNKKDEKNKKKKSVTKETNRRAAHNAVESRRKLKITQLVDQLSVLVEPSCHCGKETKVDVLQKVVEKIQEVEKKNKELKSSIKSYYDGHRSDEAQLQEQLVMAIGEHISLLLNYLRHKSRTDQQEKVQDKVILDPPSATERCGFGVAALLDTCSHQSQSLDRSTEIDQMQYSRVGLWGDLSRVYQPSVCQITTPTTDSGGGTVHSYFSSTHAVPSTSQDIVPVCSSSSSHWQLCSNHLHDSSESVGLWEQNRSFIATGVSPDSYYSETHPPSHPSQYLHDPNRTNVSNNVWRPYNDQQSQHSCLSNQVNSSFLVEQLLEKLL